MRMSCGGWAGGSNPGASPRRNSLAYRRYLRFLPSYSGPRERDSSETPNDNDSQDVLSPESQEIIDPYRKKEEEQQQQQGKEEEEEEKMIDISSVGGEEALTTLVVEGNEAPRRRHPDDCSRRREKEILRERGLSRWLKDQEDVQTPTQCHMFADNSSEEDKHRKDDGDKPPDVSVSSLVRQYTAMLNARNANSSSSSSLSPNALQTSRSCSSIVTKTNKFSRLYGPPPANSGGDDRKEGRHSSIDSGDGDSSDGLLGSRYRSFSLPWPSDTNWRWSSDPNIMANTAPQPQAVDQPTKPSGGNIINQHSNSLARLDSGTSDEGCPRDGSTGPTPPLSPVFRGLGPNHHLCGLITPFKSLSPASSMGSHLGSVEDIPLSRSMSFGHVIDRLIRSRSADSAVEVEEDSGLPSSAAATSQQQQQQQQQKQQEAIQDSEKDIRVTKSKGDVGVIGDVEGGGNLCGECGEIKQPVSGAIKCCDDGQCEVISGGGDLLGALPNGDIPCGGGGDEGHSSEEVFCDCGTEGGESCDHQRRDEDSPDEGVPVELRRKEGKIYGSRRERRCGEVDGDMLIRRVRGCGGVAGAGVFQDIVDDSDRKVLRTPSVVISDHSGDTVSLTVALASSDFSIAKLDDKFQPPPSVSPASSSPSLCVGDDASRKVSSCSSCSSVSTVDMTTPLTPMLTPGLDCLMEIPNRRISDCSTASNVSISEEEMEQPLPRPPPPKKQSNWRKVRNIVQWTPFIQTYKKHKYPWVQLAGHQGNFKAGYKQGTILKKLCPPEEKALGAIMKDLLRPYVPQFMGVVEGTDGEKYLQLQDLLSDFELPCVMDIKMGVRTYLEDELAKAREKPKLRKDMYEKMVQIDPKAPTEAEHRAKAVTKPRYMVWRETISSTATQGFRIEGVRRGDGTSSKDFKTTRTREQVLSALRSFLQGYSNAASRYVQQLKSIKVTLEASPFFNSHELIGSSLLFVHNDTSATVRMIDFAKTIPLPENVHITHRSPWSEGTHEDGYLLGLDNLIDLFSSVEKIMSNNESSKTGVQNSTVQEQTNSSSSSIINDATSESKGPDSNSSSKGSATTTPTTISSPLPSVNNHTPVPVNASLT